MIKKEFENKSSNSDIVELDKKDILKLTKDELKSNRTKQVENSSRLIDKANKDVVNEDSIWKTIGDMFND